MLKEAIEKIVELAEPSINQPVNGRPDLSYSDKPVQLIVPPSVSSVRVSTLTGLADLVRAAVDGLDPKKWLLHVTSYSHVRLVARETDDYGRRPELATAVWDAVTAFPFGRFVDREEFVIGLQSQFRQDGDLPEVLRLASTLEASLISQSEDDGISQRATVKQGVSLKQTTIVKGRVSLRPYRTFHEVMPPLSEFVFRLRSQAGEVPSCALFEADGGAWKMAAVLSIREWLVVQNLNLPVIV